MKIGHMEDEIEGSRKLGNKNEKRKEELGTWEYLGNCQKNGMEENILKNGGNVRVVHPL